MGSRAPASSAQLPGSLGSAGDTWGQRPSPGPSCPSRSRSRSPDMPVLARRIVIGGFVAALGCLGRRSDGHHQDIALYPDDASAVVELSGVGHQFGAFRRAGGDVRARSIVASSGTGRDGKAVPRQPPLTVRCRLSHLQQIGRDGARGERRDDLVCSRAASSRRGLSRAAGIRGAGATSGGCRLSCSR